MSFFAYIAIVFVSIAGILLELDWLTKPKSETRSPVQVATRTVAPAPQANAKVKGQSTDLTPVYPKNPETRQSDDTVHHALAKPPVAQQPPAADAFTANVTQAEHQPAAATKDAAPPAQQADGSTGGRAPAYAAESPPAPAAVVAPSAQTRSAAAAPDRCDVQACSSAYQSFRVSDCTYKPYEGPRRTCVRPPVTERAVASRPRAEAAYRKRDDDTDRDVVARRVKSIDADDDDADDEDDRGTARSRVIVIERPVREPWW